MRALTMVLVLLSACGAALSSEPATRPALHVEIIKGDGAGRVEAAAFLPDGAFVIAGFTDAKWQEGGKAVSVGGKGFLSRRDAGGKALQEVMFDKVVSDLAADPKGHIYVAGAFGARKFGPRLEPVWAHEQSAAAPGSFGRDEGGLPRVAALEDGGAVVFSPVAEGRRSVNRIFVIGQDGKTVRHFDAGGGFLNDLTYDPASKHVIVCGFDNKSGVSKDGKRGPVQVAFAIAYNLEGQRVWKAWGWTGQQMFDTRLLADTRAYRCEIGADGKLYILGESAGGNSMFHRSGQDLEKDAPFTVGDQFQKAFNMQAAHVAAVVRLDPRTGEVERATLLLGRNDAGLGAPVRLRGVAADKDGNVLVGGYGHGRLPRSPGSFGLSAPGAFVAILDPEFKRTFATTLVDGPSAVRAVAIAPDRILLAGLARGAVAGLPDAPTGDEGKAWLTLLENPINKKQP